MKKNKILFTLTLLLLTFSPLHAAILGQQAEMPTVKSVQLEQYLGQWYEIMRIPNEFQDQTLRGGFTACQDTVAEYQLLPKNKISVQNTCHRYNAKGEEKIEVAKAIAYAEKNSGNAKLKVNFTGLALLRALGIGDGRYWILSLGPVNAEGLYSWVLVGEPTRKYGWILSREEELDPAVVQELLMLAKKLGYQPELFRAFR